MWFAVHLDQNFIDKHWPMPGPERDRVPTRIDQILTRPRWEVRHTGGTMSS
jgi:hypothetical protein